MRTDEGRINSTKELKILGFTFGCRPDAGTHLNKLETKWALRCLKKAGFQPDKLLVLFNAVLRPVIEYCSSTYHSLLTKDQSNRLEDLQARALKVIYGWNMSYRKILEISGQETLENRRKNTFDRFAQKTLKNPRYKDWFPLVHDSGHDTRNECTFLEEFAKTERYKNSPVFLMRRRLNEMKS